MENNRLYVSSNMKYKDYLSYCFYPIFRQKIYKIGFIISFVMFILISIYLVFAAIFDLMSTSNITTILIVLSLYLILISFLIIRTLPNYLRNKSKFNATLNFIFYDNKISIANENFKEGLIIQIRDINYIDEKKNKIFIVLYNGKYYMLDKNKIHNGNIFDIRNYFIEKLKKVSK